MYANKIPQFASHEFDVKILVIKIKRAVIDHQIANTVAVNDPQGAVSENRIELLSGRAGNQGYPQSFRRLRICFVEQQNKDEQQGR